MKRIKILIAAAIAAMALSAALGTNAASASSLISSGAVRIVAAPTKSHMITLGGPVRECEAPAFTTVISSTYANPDITPEGPLSNYKCNYGGITTFKPNGCTFTFHPGEETASGEFAGTVDIGPSNCGPMSTTYLAGCKSTIAPKTGLAVTLKNEGSGSGASVKLTIATNALKYTDSCGGGEGETGTYQGSWQLEGRGPENSQKGIHIAAPVLYVSGEKSEESAKQPKFNSDFFPIGYRGTTASKFVLGTMDGNVECGSNEYLGAAFVATSNKLLTPTFAGCQAFGFKVVATAHGCETMFKLANSGPPYTGSIELVCPEPGQYLELVAKFLGSPVCSVVIPPQVLGSVAYENAGSAGLRHIVATVKGEGISYEIPAWGACGGSGSATNGTLSTVINLGGRDH
ncbi:MAG TPA: hypothetical protein VMS11_09775 [Solirubrobacterales bacterium]|nr:hypothetical protein [Solirubrobacterales bacterium]